MTATLTLIDEILRRSWFLRGTKPEDLNGKEIAFFPYDTSVYPLTALIESSIVKGEGVFLYVPLSYGREVIVAWSNLRETKGHPEHNRWAATCGDGEWIFGFLEIPALNFSSCGR